MKQFRVKTSLNYNDVVNELVKDKLVTRAEKDALWLDFIDSEVVNVRHFTADYWSGNIDEPPESYRRLADHLTRIAEEAGIDFYMITW